MSSFDGTNKGTGISITNIDYAAENAVVPSRILLRDSIIKDASEDALKVIDPRTYKVSFEKDETGAPRDASTMSANEWQARRKGNRVLKTLGTVGASSISKVMGDCPYLNGCTNLDCYHEMLGDSPVVPDAPDPAREHIFAVGHAAEAWLQKKLKEMYPAARVIVDTRIYNDPDRPFETANLDFMMQLSDGSWVHGEFKTTNPFTSYAAYHDGLIPEHYREQLIQCQHLLNVDESRLVVAVMKPTIEKVPVKSLYDPRFDFGKFVDQVITRTYIRDLEREAEQHRRIDDFWYQHVLPEIEPEILGKPIQVDNAIKRWKPTNGAPSLVKLPSSTYADACQRVIEAQEKVKQLSHELKVAKERAETEGIALKQAMGQTQIAVVADPQNPGGAYEITYTVNRGRVSFKGDILKAKDPALYEKLVASGYVIPARKQAGRSFSVALK